MENTLELTTAKAIAGRFRNNGVGQPQMYINTLMITRILFEWGLPEDLVLLIVRIVVRDTHRLLMREVRLMRELQPQWPQDSVYPVNSRQLRWNLAKASTRLEKPIWQVIELPDADDEVADLAGTFERMRLGARSWLAKTELEAVRRMQEHFREQEQGSLGDHCLLPGQVKYFRAPFAMFRMAYGYTNTTCISACEVPCSASGGAQIKEFVQSELHVCHTYKGLVERRASKREIRDTIFAQLDPWRNW